MDAGGGSPQDLAATIAPRPRAGAKSSGSRTSSPNDRTSARPCTSRPVALTLDDLQATARRRRGACGSTPQRATRIRASAAVVQRAAAGDAPVYGVNTGFGKLASTRIDARRARTLQLNLIRSHSVGVGEPLRRAVVRLMLALKAASLARGHSGVREAVVDTLLAVHNAGLVPYVPSQGSVGASGDLAPLAHMTLALIGEGELLVDGERAPGARRAARRRHRAAGARSQGRPRADQRHAGLDRARAACAAHVRAGARGRARRRRAHGRRGARQRRPVRSAHPRAARPAGADRRRALLPRAARRQRDPPLAPARRRPRAGSVLACAASRRWSAPASTSCATPRWCCCARPMR